MKHRTLNEAGVELKVGLTVGYGDHEWEIVHVLIDDRGQDEDDKKRGFPWFPVWLFHRGKLREVRGFEVTLERGSKYGNRITKRLFNPTLYVPEVVS